jgi:hypothetical protein
MAATRRRSWTWARIGHSDLHFAAHGCTRPHTGLTSKIAKAGSFRRSQALNCNVGAWGGWDSNPGPADYESSKPATCPIPCDLRGHGLTRSWLARFGHVFGMIMLNAGRARLSRPGTNAAQTCV